MPRRRVRVGHGQPCHWCKRKMIGYIDTSPSHPLLVTKDHVIPQVVHGGDDDNIVLCCRACNAVKGSLSPPEWAAFRAARPEWWNLYR
jgi:hypothetical protein